MTPNNFQNYAVICRYFECVGPCDESTSQDLYDFVKENKGNFHNFIEFLFLGVFLFLFFFCMEIWLDTAGDMMIIIFVIRVRDGKSGSCVNIRPFLGQQKIQKKKSLTS